MVLMLCRSSHVTEWTQFCHRQMDGQTDRQTDAHGKNNMSPESEVGRYNKVGWLGV